MEKAQSYGYTTTLVSMWGTKILISPTHLQALGMKEWQADDLTDFLAVPSFAGILNLDQIKMSEFREHIDNMGEVIGAMREEGDLDYRLILQNAGGLSEQLPDWVLLAPDNEKALHLLLMNCKNKVNPDKKLRFYATKLHRLFSLASRLVEGELIDKARMAHEFGVSTRTVERDIALLNDIGYFSEYDSRRKGYRMPAEFHRGDRLQTFRVMDL